MRRYTENDKRVFDAFLLRNGLKFVAPVAPVPSSVPPFRAIVDAVERKRKCGRKRFVQLIMSTGNGRRVAEYVAYTMQRKEIPYWMCLRLIMIPAIQHADESMDRILHGVLVPEKEAQADGDPGGMAAAGS